MRGDTLARRGAHTAAAAEALRLTADDLKRLRLVDEVVPEPLGGAHRDPASTIEAVAEAVERGTRGRLLAMDGVTLKARRREKYMEMGPRSDRLISL